MRLDTQLSQLYIGRRQVLSYQAALLHVVPTTFKSLSEARRSLDSLANAACHLMHDMSTYGLLGDDSSAEVHRLVPSVKFTQWATAFEYFMANDGTKLTEKEKHGANLLRIHHLLFLEIVDLVDSQDEMAWDRFQDNFATVVRLAKPVAASLSKCSSRLPKDPASVSRAPQKIFSMEQGIVGSLFEVVYKCRHPAIRRKALKILKSCPRQESSWDGGMTTIIAERLIEVEEKAARAHCSERQEKELKSCKDIPRWARVSKMDLEIPLEGKKAFWTYLRPKSLEDPTLVSIEETIEW